MRHPHRHHSQHTIKSTGSVSVLPTKKSYATNALIPETGLANGQHVFLKNNNIKALERGIVGECFYCLKLSHHNIMMMGSSSSYCNNVNVVEQTLTLHFENMVRFEMDLRNKFTLAFVVVTLFSLIDGDGLRLPDQQSSPNIHPLQQLHQQQQQQQQIPQQQQPQNININNNNGGGVPNFGEERGRQGKGLLDLFGLGTGANVDPYIAKTNQNCLTGDLSECFKTQALNSFDEIFVREAYTLSDFARVVRTPESQQRSLFNEPFEFSSEPRDIDSEWDQLVKYALRRAERFIKTTALEVQLPEEITEGGRYQARFIGDIDSELDVIEDKHAPLLNRKKLKKLFIPLLLVLKIFKLKLLLFLPFILGIAGLKKILGLAAIILPGLFAYFKLCRPQGLGTGVGGFGGLFNQKNNFPEYSQQGIGSASYHHHEHFDGGNGNPFYRQEPSFAKPYTEYYSKNTNTNGISFGEPSHQQDLAYQGYSQQYGRSTNKDIKSTN
ncbi:uncharacterized protein LOC129914945 [Episyrphus balteatus]|uniref:uncharacterized protein LOC129914945 n=1 Tax=Episyrphus balteatus TaxID=286459 RepID=UPI002486B5E3|nr:uncharacterized protein LOC129914945 [Episyrphus balteatus]